MGNPGDVVVRQVDAAQAAKAGERLGRQLRDEVLLEATARSDALDQHSRGGPSSLRGATHSSVVSSGRVTGTLVRLFSRQSTIPSAQRHGCGQLFSTPHSIGACSVRPETKSGTDRSESLNTLVAPPPPPADLDLSVPQPVATNMASDW